MDRDGTMARLLLLGAGLLLVVGCAHRATTPPAEPATPPVDATPPGGGVAVPAEPVADPSVEGALTLVEADAVPDGQPIRLVAWLWALPADCPPCPEGYECEQCLPPLPLFGNEPPHTGPGGTGRSFWVAVRPSLTGSEIGIDAIGQRFVLSGAWSTDHGAHGRLLVSQETTPAPAPAASGRGAAEGR